MPEASERRPHLLFLVTEDWYFCSHRLPLARAAHGAGYQVTVATRVDRCGPQIEAEGFRLIAIDIERGELHPLRDLKLLLALVRLYRQARPDIAHQVALKPVLYGSIAARIARVPLVVNAFAGLGYLFSGVDRKRRALGALVTRVLWGALRGLAGKVVLQNEDDRELLLELGVVRREDTLLIRGSGVDLDAFRFAPLPTGEPLVVLPARLLWDKGVGEFVRAARELRRAGTRARFVLAGSADPKNPQSVPVDVLERWRREGAVELWGHQDDMPSVLAASHVVCLPSYREGLPKVLLEAGAVGRPAVVTDVPGCRDAVLPNETALLVPPRDARALGAAISKLLEDSARARSMGERARRHVEDHFSDRKIAAETLALYDRLLRGAR